MLGKALKERVKKVQSEDCVTKEVLQHIMVEKELISRIELGPMGNEERQELAGFLRCKDRLFIGEEGLIRLSFNGGRSFKSKGYVFGKKEKNRLIIPKTLRQEVMAMVHDAPMAGHMGMNRTWQRIRDCAFWPDMKADVERYVGYCEKCNSSQ